MNEGPWQYAHMYGESNRTLRTTYNFSALLFLVFLTTHGDRLDRPWRIHMAAGHHGPLRQIQPCPRNRTLMIAPNNSKPTALLACRHEISYDIHLQAVGHCGLPAARTCMPSWASALQGIVQPACLMQGTPPTSIQPQPSSMELGGAVEPHYAVPPIDFSGTQDP
jgi:hypothetical protein